MTARLTHQKLIQTSLVCLWEEANQAEARTTDKGESE